MKINGRTCDGFREWLPESCLWGSSEDGLPCTREKVLKNTKAIIVSRIATRAIGILQFTYKESGESDEMLLGYMIVGIVGNESEWNEARVGWSKSF